VTIIAPKANVEIPLYEFWFSTEEGNRTWRQGIAQLPKGKHQVRITTGCSSLTVLDPDTAHFRKNFDFPPFDFELK